MPENRTAITAAVKRQVMMESGDLCAVCGHSDALELAHIKPWKETQDNRAENLICLCANCHTKADKQRWNGKKFHGYKLHPWVERYRRQAIAAPVHSTPMERAPSETAPVETAPVETAPVESAPSETAPVETAPIETAPLETKRVRIVIDADYEDFTRRELKLLKDALASYLEISADSVQVQEIEEGSVLIDIDLPISATTALIEGFQAQDPALLAALGEIPVTDIQPQIATLAADVENNQENDNPDEVLTLLRQWSGGDEQALEQVMPLVMPDLLRIARQVLSLDWREAAVEPNELVNEAYLRLVGRKTYWWSDRTQFFTALTELMRRIMVDGSRRRLAAKRNPGGPTIHIDKISETVPLFDADGDLPRLNEAMEGLKAHDERMYKIVMLWFFVGMSQKEIAEELGASVSSVSRQWQSARQWLAEHLGAS